MAERATQIALEARMPEAAIESAKVWADAAPDSPRALGAAASLLVSANRVDEAQPYLMRILAASGEGRGDGFLQVNRLLANNPDKGASLRAMQSLAAPYPTLAQARFAVAASAANAEQDDIALKEIRAASQLKPDWELAALFEAQLLQKKSNAAASERLAQYLKEYPKSREVRLAYARMLVADKKYPEARLEFERLVKEYPDNTDVVFSVAVLSMQLEDWPAAETNLKRLLDLGYRDRNAVRFYLGQVAEEQKHFPDALQWYSEVTRGEQFMPAQIRSAQVLWKQGDLDGARKYLQQVNAQSNDQRVQLILAEAQLLRDAKQEKEAFGVVDQALDKLPNHPDLLYDHAMLAEKLDRVDILESSLRKLIRIKPDHAHAYNALGYTLADRNQRLEEAQELIDTGAQAFARRRVHHGQHGLGAVPPGQGGGGAQVPAARLRDPSRRRDRGAPRRGIVGARPSRRGTQGLGRGAQEDARQRSPDEDRPAARQVARPFRARVARSAMRTHSILLLATVATALLGACASLPPPVPRAGEFAVVGRVAVRYGDEAASGRVAWRHSDADDDLVISTPLGQGIAEITRREGVYTLVAADRQRFTASDPERLTEQALGYALPLDGLPDWLRGRAQPGVPAEARYDGKQLAELRQQGWTIEYLAYEDDGRLPRRLRLTRGALDIRLAIEEWQVAPR